MASRRLGLLGITLAAGALVASGHATTRAEEPKPGFVPRLESARTEPRPTGSSEARATARLDADDPVLALAQPLDESERADLERLAARLGAGSVKDRAETARAIREKYGVRAARELLRLSSAERDPETRLRARSLVSSLVFAYYLERVPGCGFLGINWTMSTTRQHCFAAHVGKLTAGGPAWSGGVREGDEIVAFDGKPFDGQDDFIDRVQTAVPGTRVAVTVERGGQEITVTVTMGRRLNDDGTPYLPYPHFARDLATRKLAHWLEEVRRSTR